MLQFGTSRTTMRDNSLFVSRLLFNIIMCQCRCSLVSDITRVVLFTCDVMVTIGTISAASTCYGLNCSRMSSLVAVIILQYKLAFTNLFKYTRIFEILNNANPVSPCVNVTWAKYPHCICQKKRQSCSHSKLCYHFHE